LLAGAEKEFLMRALFHKGTSGPGKFSVKPHGPNATGFPRIGDDAPTAICSGHMIANCDHRFCTWLSFAAFSLLVKTAPLAAGPRATFYHLSQGFGEPSPADAFCALSSLSPLAPFGTCSPRLGLGAAVRAVCATIPA